MVAREVFSRFKAYTDYQAGHPMLELLLEISRAAAIDRDFTEKADILDGPLDRVGLFAYRVKTLEREVIDVLESWLARRMLIRATGKSYSKIMTDVVSVIRNARPEIVGQTLVEYFSSQRSEAAYWPDDEEVRREVEVMPVYRKLSRARVRMLLESIEDHWRGWIRGQISSAGMRIRRASYVCFAPVRSPGGRQDRPLPKPRLAV